VARGERPAISDMLRKSATILGDGTDEDFVATEAPDVVIAGGGDDSIHGLGGGDLLCGGPGRDQIDEGQRQRGNDTLTGENPPVHPDVRDKCQGGPGRDRRLLLLTGPYPDQEKGVEKPLLPSAE
jgi:Ca2+-binding RTX toxin-like protein